MMMSTYFRILSTTTIIIITMIVAGGLVVPVVYDRGGGVHSSGYLCIDCLRNELYKNKEDRPQKQKNQLPKSITMAEDLKKKEFLQKKAKLGDGSNIAAEDR